MDPASASAGSSYTPNTPYRTRVVARWLSQDEDYEYTVIEKKMHPQRKLGRTQKQDEHGGQPVTLPVVDILQVIDEHGEEPVILTEIDEHREEGPPHRSTEESTSRVEPVLALRNRRRGSSHPLPKKKRETVTTCSDLLERRHRRRTASPLQRP